MVDAWVDSSDEAVVGEWDSLKDYSMVDAKESKLADEMDVI